MKSESVVMQKKLKKKLQDLGVTVFIFDMDETIYKTKDLFDKYISEFRDYVASVFEAEELSIDAEEFKLAFEREEVNCYLSGSANLLENTKIILSKIFPERYLKFLNKDKIEDLDEEQLVKIEKVLELLLAQTALNKIYNHVPEFLPGVEGMLKTLHGSELELGFCTHSGQAWGELKLEPIKAFFNEDCDFYLNSIALDQKKDASSWADSLEAMNKNPEEAIVIGDNPISDILSAFEVGVRKMIFINPNEQEDETVKQLREKGAQIWEVKDPSEIIEALLS